MASSNNRRLGQKARVLAKAENISYQKALQKLQAQHSSTLDEKAKELFAELVTKFFDTQADAFYLSLNRQHWTAPGSKERLDLHTDHWFTDNNQFGDFLKRICVVYGKSKDVFGVYDFDVPVYVAVANQDGVPTMTLANLESPSIVLDRPMEDPLMQSKLLKTTFPQTTDEKTALWLALHKRDYGQLVVRKEYRSWLNSFKGTQTKIQTNKNR